MLYITVDPYTPVNPLDQPQNTVEVGPAQNFPSSSSSRVTGIDYQAEKLLGSIRSPDIYHIPLSEHLRDLSRPFTILPSLRKAVKMAHTTFSDLRALPNSSFSIQTTTVDANPDVAGIGVSATYSRFNNRYHTARHLDKLNY